MITKTNAKISKIEQLTSSVNHFVLKLDQEVSYESGQFVNIIYQNKDEKIRRPYSIAGKPELELNSELELCIKLVEEGQFTPILFNENIKDVEFQVMVPLGLFKLRNFDRNQVFIGAGTGVAPLRSFILDLLENKKVTSNITLLLGIRYEDEILYEDEFKQLENKFPNFKFIPTISKPTENWKGKVGHVQNHISDIENIENSEYYICGLTALVNACVEELDNFNVKKEQIKFEKYG